MKLSDGKGDQTQGSTASVPWDWVVPIGLLVFGGVVVWAVLYKNFILAQAGILAIFALILVGSARLTSMFLFSSRNSKDREKERLRASWLMRLVVLAALGLGAIMLYAIQYKNWGPARVASAASVGFIAAGAAWLAGALIGFVFGVPHTRRGDNQSGKRTAKTGESPIVGSQARDAGGFDHSTSLEEISDWLTKIIVGVGLTQLNQIPIKLDALGYYIAVGIDDCRPNKALGIGIFVYFFICGFLFGYLWARLYMLEAFSDAGRDSEEPHQPPVTISADSTAVEAK